MSRSQRVGRLVGLGVVLLFVVAACGDDDAADPQRLCEINDEIEQLDLFGVALDSVRDVVREGRLLMDEAVKVAPDEIRDSVELAADSFRLFLDLVEAAEFDPGQINEEDLAAAFSDEALAAGEALEEWVDANCSA